ncbi:spore cortex-lytic enzyme [Paenibacillus sp. D2_2]|uniref:spore cortex-lytic enzyme n=1 Tax=Paenibacillus sp. D2_2 TaxID=3073092 RepID=UPI002814C594|nr:spore cortex-lytic enzyme [Paenibacillus sp. D2_2]WMT39144.1 spore cortex-lytic enzyme [Paenibacillus sp. D2_2]
MIKAKIWYAAGLVLLLFGLGFGIYHLIQNNDVNTNQEVPELAVPVFSEQVITYGAFGQDVYELQGRLAFLGFYYGKIDHRFGPKTRDSLKWFQSEFGLKVDGLAGPKTKLMLWKATKQWKPGMESNQGTGKETAKTPAKEPEKGKTESEDLSPSNAMGLSQNDLNIMANAVYGESRGEPFEGQVAVAAVILNRVKSPSFPNTVSGVIFQPGAFTAVADGQIWLTPNENAKKAVQQALNGWDPSGGCLYYFNPETATSKWIWTRPQVKTIGKHIFCM